MRPSGHRLGEAGAKLAGIGRRRYIPSMSGTFEDGRTAPAEGLAADLSNAPFPYLEGALANPAFHPELILFVLKNVHVTPGLLKRIASSREWLKTYEVRSAIVLHPKTPRVIAMNLVSHLWWRDLVRVVDRPALAPPMKRAAERILAIRVQEMATGERITLARIASRGIFHVLRVDPNPMVIRALLQNPKLLEEDAVAIAAGRRTQSDILQVIADDPRWSPRPAVRKALARHPATPSQVALRMIRHLTRRDLREVSASPLVPGLVRVAIGRILQENGSGDGRRGKDGKRRGKRRRASSTC